MVPAALAKRVCADASRVLESRFGGNAIVDLREVLGSRLSVISRANAYMDSSIGPRSVILKHLMESWYGDPLGSNTRREFLEEAAAYEFLEGLSAGFIDRPKLYGRHPAGLLVMEDLGPGDHQVLTAGVLSNQIAVVLAHLHNATAPHGAAYAATRDHFGLTDANDNRYESELEVRRRFDKGSGVLAEWCTILDVTPGSEVQALLDEVRFAVFSAGPFHSLIHDDLVNGRQCRVRENSLLLFDFENARWGHCLRDLAKPLVGKFERHLETGYMILVCPELDAELPSAYRRERARDGSLDVDTPAWDQALCDAVLFHAVVQIGVLMDLMARTEVAGQVLPNLKLLIRRSTWILNGHSGREELRQILGRLCSRIH